MFNPASGHSRFFTFDVFLSPPKCLARFLSRFKSNHWFATHSISSLDTQRGAEIVLVCSPWPQLLIPRPLVVHDCRGKWTKYCTQPLFLLRSSRTSFPFLISAPCFCSGDISVVLHNSMPQHLHEKTVTSLAPVLPPSPNFVRSRRFQSVLLTLGCRFRGALTDMRSAS